MQEYQFRGIQKSEWNNLFNFIQAKRLRIENVAEAEMGPSGAARPGLDIDLGEDIDTGICGLSQTPEIICPKVETMSLLEVGMSLRCGDWDAAGASNVSRVTGLMEQTFVLF